jgi:hypothetical protein
LDEIKVCDGPGLVENRLKIVRQKWGVHAMDMVKVIYEVQDDSGPSTKFQ